jgi:signal transduction histidine kinase
VTVTPPPIDQPARGQNRSKPAQRVAAVAPQQFTRILVIGAVVSILLLVSVVVAATLAIARVERSTFDLALRGERSAFVAGDIADQLALLQANVASAVHRQTGSSTSYVARVGQIRRLLQEEMDLLPSLLHQEQREAWLLIRPQIELLERDLMVALERLHAGQGEAAAAILELRADDVTRIHEALDALGEAHEERLIKDLDSARRTAGDVRLVELAVGGALLLATLAIWLAVLRAIRRQAALLAENTRKLELANEELDAFAGRVAHDLRNAVTPLALSAGVLRRFANSPERVQRVAGRLEGMAGRLSAIIDSLLTFSRAGSESTSDEEAPVGEAIAAVLDELEPTVQRLGASVSVDVEPTLQARCSAPMLYLLLMNLCSNAVKFLEGRERREVHIRGRAEDEWCVLTIEDTGPGIPEHERERIFEAFYRVPGSVAPGTGIGLATVRRILDVHGGRIAVGVTEEGGTRFSVKLPLGAPAELPLAAAAAVGR